VRKKSQSERDEGISRPAHEVRGGGQAIAAELDTPLTRFIVKIRAVNLTRLRANWGRGGLTGREGGEEEEEKMGEERGSRHLRLLHSEKQ